MLVSIIISVYNIRQYISDCIDSVLRQSYNNWECILVDDGSTDGSEMICDTYAKNDSRITVIHKKNGGLASARNAGIKAAKGEYLYFIDGDDKIKEDTLAHFVELLSGEKCDFILGHMSYFYDDNEPQKRGNVIKNSWVEGKTGKEAFVEIHKRLNFIAMGVRGLYLNSFIVSNNLYFKDDCRYSEDQEWTPRLFEKAKCIKSNEIPDYLYREGRPGSLMNTLNPHKVELTLNIYDDWHHKIMENQHEKFYQFLYVELIYRLFHCYVCYPKQLDKASLPLFYEMMDRRRVIAKDAPKDVPFNIRRLIIKYLPCPSICALLRMFRKIGIMKR